MHKFEWHVYATQSVSATIIFKEIEILHGNNYALHLMNIAIHVAKEKVILFVINAMNMKFFFPTKKERRLMKRHALRATHSNNLHHT